MGSVGLLYVGAVLFINGLMLVGLIPGKSAAILNFFVGTMQVIFPTLIILQANNDPAVIFGAAGLYLFGFTYLYVGILQVTGFPGEGLGWFSLFVAICAVIIGVIQFTSVHLVHLGGAVVHVLPCAGVAQGNTYPRNRLVHHSGQLPDRYHSGVPPAAEQI
jgi:hypothetical protein